MDGTDERRLTNEKFYGAGNPHFSPDQSRVVFCATRNSQDEGPTVNVVISDFDKAGNLTMFKWMPKASGPGGIRLADNCDPSFSPSGDAIVFISNRVSRPSPYDYEVWITDPSFSQTVQLTHLQARLAAPTFTSDGVHILFTEWSSERRLWRMKRDGSELTRLH
jgi:Tol biopolymer transport system component